jgi:integrase
MQRGNIRKRHGSWQLRYYVNEIGPEGTPVRRQITKTLARVSDEYRTARDCWPLADPYLAPENRGAATPEGSLTVADFADRYFLPYIKAKRKRSTHKFYKDAIENHLRDRVGFVRLRDFTARHAQEVLDATPLSHQSLLRIKTTMSAIFSYAIRLAYVIGANPVREAKAEGTRSDPKRHAYTLKDVEYILTNLPEPARTVCAVAAFGGLRESEIRGLQWQDYTGDFLHVRRSVWRTHVGETKTPESKNAVPVIGPLRKLLDQHRIKSNANGDDTKWIFAGGKKGFALHLDNLCRRDMKPVLGDRWLGWHAFRRGLGTNLFGLGVPAEVAQTILRHANVSTTRTHYIVLESQQAGSAAMQKLETAVLKVGQIRASRKAKKRRKPHKH